MFCTVRRSVAASSAPWSRRSVAAPTALWSRRGLSFNAPSPRRLKDVAKLPLLERNRPERVKLIWEEYHKDMPLVLGSLLSATEYYSIVRNGRGNQYFVLPAKKGDGYFTLLSQWQDSVCFLTFLEDFKRDPSSAQPYLCFTMYNELLSGSSTPATERYPVLCRTDICNPVLSKAEAARIIDLLVKHYTWPQLLTKVFDFNQRPRQFDFEKHVKQCLTSEITPLGST